MDKNETVEEDRLKSVSSRISDHIVPLHRRLAPDCFNNMALFGDFGCRIGSTDEKPYSGVTQVVDFCAHAHQDTSNMIGGCTAIITLTKEENREGRGSDEQYHCLPQYVPQASAEELRCLEAEGGIEVLQSFRKKVLLVSEEGKRCRGGAGKRRRTEAEDSSPPCGQEEDSDLLVYESDCREVFQNPDAGGIAFSLPHGSLLLEVARHEVHSTTALLEPSRQQPTRIGLVYYQHHNLHLQDHGATAWRTREYEAQHAKYMKWLRGEFVPYQGEYNTLTNAGYVFPDRVILKDKKQMKPTPETVLRREEFPDFVPGKTVDGRFVPIHIQEDWDYEKFCRRLDSEPMSLH